MAEHVLVELVTPERLFASVRAAMVEVPGEAGDFGVLPGHAPLISSIRPGVVTIYAESGAKSRYLVVGGMAEVLPDRCVILAEYLEDVSAVSRDDAEKRFVAAKKAQAVAITNEEKRISGRECEVSEALALALNAV